MPSAPKHWSVDFVQHLRTVHFTLLFVAVSLALLATAPRTDVQAKNALPSILQFSKAHDDWPKEWVEEFRPDHDKQDLLSPTETLTFYLPPDNPQRDTPFTNIGEVYYANGFPFINRSNIQPELQTEGLAKIDVTLVAPAHVWTAKRRIFDEVTSYRFTEVDESASSLYVETPPATLKEFHDLWDKLPSTEIAFFTGWGLGGANFIAEDDGAGKLINAKKVVWLPHPPDRSIQKVDLRLDSQSLSYTAAVFLPNGERGRLTLQAFGGGGYKVQPWQVVKFAEERCSSAKGTTPIGDCGPFIKVFPELVEIEDELGEVPFDKLIDEVVRRASSPPQPIELLGIKFPKITQWGIVLVLAIQLYLWLHTHEMSGKIESMSAPGLDVAWIGVYPSKTSRVAFLISLLIPSLVILLLAYYLPTTLRTSLIVGSMAGLFSVIVALGTFRSMRILPKANEAPSKPTPSLP